jgi:hypothetical protein
MFVGVRPGQLWELTDRFGNARLVRVVRVGEPMDGVQRVLLRRIGSGSTMSTTLDRLQRQVDGARLVEE